VHPTAIPHMVIEYARHVLGYEDAQHAEYDPYASCLFVSASTCSLVGKTMPVTLTPGSHYFAQVEGQEP
jgi:CTP synthase (UTP-ammonia lyase)